MHNTLPAQVVQSAFLDTYSYVISPISSILVCIIVINVFIAGPGCSCDGEVRRDDIGRDVNRVITLLLSSWSAFSYIPNCCRIKHNNGPNQSLKQSNKHKKNVQRISTFIVHSEHTRIHNILSSLETLCD